MEGGAIWLTTIGTIIGLSALILVIAIVLRRRRRSLK
ncbi:LPXTG cell wall anchor domain-containing protein [Microvirga aerilata]|jgi:LPXTG-motif cell wall-anchored protein|uniref:LPXTG cell wall anchor domain-containing protein n=1 Tax=Microvirga aerilata TaxID=670292 RepID=A0A936Z6L3_9HYPH|nr:LPXTG cell wall anchor domain-containing protein [Microvirga aerilata]MBL0402487.1 LPXTG cell wall anchor domain-containing protein [Microvirga aerilata]